MDQRSLELALATVGWILLLGVAVIGEHVRDCVAQRLSSRSSSRGAGRRWVGIILGGD